MGKRLADQLLQWGDFRWWLRPTEGALYQRAFVMHPFKLIPRLRLTDLDHVPWTERVLLDATAVDLSSTRTARVLNDRRSLMHLQATVRARHARIVEPHITRLPAPHDQYSPIGQLDALPLIGPFHHLQVLLHGMLRRYWRRWVSC